MSVENVISKAQIEIDSGNFWRAQEIICSSFGNHGFDAEMNAVYSKVLLCMRDEMQAGKYLFYG